MQALIRVTAFAALLLLAACAPAAENYTEPPYGAAQPTAGAGQEYIYDESAERAVDGVEPDSFAPIVAPAERLVIKDATLSLIVVDPAKSVTEIAKLAESMGGFVVSSNVYQTTIAAGEAVQSVNYGSIAVRVPADRLIEALELIKAGAVEVENENINSQDITQEYTDLQSRLKNLEAAEAQLQRIMEQAEKTEDVLAVYNQLVMVREQIEVLRGQMHYYQQAAALSSISVSLTPDAASQPIEIGGWRPQGTVKEAVETLLRTLQGLVDALIWLVICVLPFALPIIALVRWVVVRRRKAKGGTSPT